MGHVEIEITWRRCSLVGMPPPSWRLRLLLQSCSLFLSLPLMFQRQALCSPSYPRTLCPRLIVVLPLLQVQVCTPCLPSGSWQRPRLPCWSLVPFWRDRALCLESKDKEW